MFRHIPLSWVSVSKDKFLVESWDLKIKRELPGSITALLVAFWEFKTAEDLAKDHFHSLKIRERLRLLWSVFQFQVQHFKSFRKGHHLVYGPIAEVVRELVRLELLMPYSEFIPMKKSLARPAKIDSLAVVTMNRPTAAVRCLESGIQNMNDFGRETALLVVDASDNDKTRKAITGAVGGSNRDITYFGNAEKRNFIAELARKGLDPQTLEFAFFPEGPLHQAYGANRNAWLLSTIDQRVVSCDDDIIFEAADPIQKIDGLFLTSYHPEEKFEFYDSMDDAYKKLEFTKRDVVGAHEEVLGQSTRELLSQQISLAEHKKSLIGLHSWALDKSVENGDFVLLSRNGIAGDSGSSGVNQFLWLDGEARKKHFKTQFEYEKMFRRRNCTKSVSRLSIFPAGEMMTTIFGLDHEKFVPPFFPLFRGEDHLFGGLLRRIHANAYTAYLPFMVKHEPLETRRQSRGDLRGFYGVSLLDIFEHILWACGARSFSEDPVRKLKFMGDCLEDFANKSDLEFKRELIQMKRNQVDGNMRHLEGLLQTYKSRPAYWAKDVNDRIKELRREAYDSSGFAIREIADFTGKKDDFDYYQKSLASYARLLRQWPEIIEATRELRRSGMVMETCISGRRKSRALKRSSAG